MKKGQLPKIDPNKSMGQVLDDLEYDKFVCYYCDKIFTGRNFLKNHRLRHCDEKGNFPCRHCDKWEPTYEKLYEHIHLRHKPKYCKDCNKKFVNSSSLLRFSFSFLTLCTPLYS